MSIENASMCIQIAARVVTSLEWCYALCVYFHTQYSGPCARKTRSRALRVAYVHHTHSLECASLQFAGEVRAGDCALAM